MIITNQSNLTFDSVLPDGGTQPGSIDSNIVQTEIITYSFTKVKSTADAFIREGEQTTQSVLFTNSSQHPLTGLQFTDTLGSGASFLASSVFINNVSFPGYDLNIGFPLPDMMPGDVTKVDYTVLADNPKTQDNVSNFATVQYNVTDPISGPRTITENSNTVNFAVISTNISNVKTVDKAIAKQGDTLKYTSTLTNNGSVLATNLLFTDTLQSGISFVENSVYINGVNYPGYNPNSSFALPDLNVGQSHIVEFTVTVL